MQVEGYSTSETSEVASWRPNGRGDPTDWDRDQQADVRWLAQVERICRQAPRSLMDLSRHQYGLARRHLRLLPGEWSGRHRPVAWVLPAAMMAAMLCPPLLARADSPIAGPEFQVNIFTTSHQACPSVAVNADGDFVIAWHSCGDQDGHTCGIFARDYDSGGNPRGPEFQVNAYATGIQMYSTVAMDADGDFVVAWQSDGQDGSSYGVYARRYDSGGNPQGSEFPVNTYTTGSQSFPSVAMDADGDFVVAWHSDGQDGSLHGVYAQRFDSGGNPQGSEFRVNTYTIGRQSRPSVAMDADGDFVVAWESHGQDASSYGVYAQRYDSGGNLQRSEFPVNTYVTGAQRFPAVAVDGDGDFIIAWDGAGLGDALGVYVRRYDSGGNPQGSEFGVNTYTTNWQEKPTVAMDGDGDFVIAWESWLQDGSVYGVYAQRYDNGGTAQGSEFRVNTYTTNSQDAPNVAVDGDGDFVVAWHSWGQDGSYYGTYARRYGLPHLSLTKGVDDDTPTRGQAIQYTLVVTSSGLFTTTGAVISDTLPEGIHFVGPVTVEPSGVGTPGAAPPNLVTDLTVGSGKRVTVTVPVSVSGNLAEGTALTNTAALTSPQIAPPVTDAKAVAVGRDKGYLPVVLKSP